MVIFPMIFLDVQACRDSKHVETPSIFRKQFNCRFLLKPKLYPTTSWVVAKLQSTGPPIQSAGPPMWMQGWESVKKGNSKI